MQCIWILLNLILIGVIYNFVSVNYGVKLVNLFVIWFKFGFRVDYKLLGQSERWRDVKKYEYDIRPVSSYGCEDDTIFDKKNFQFILILLWKLMHLPK